MYIAGLCLFQYLGALQFWSRPAGESLGPFQCLMLVHLPRIFPLSHLPLHSMLLVDLRAIYKDNSTCLVYLKI